MGHEDSYTYVFPALVEELRAVDRERLTVDLDALQLSKIVYDSAASESGDDAGGADLVEKGG